VREVPLAWCCYQASFIIGSIQMLALEKLASVTRDLLFIGTYINLRDLRFTQSARSTTIPRTGSACVSIRGGDSMRGIQKSGARKDYQTLSSNDRFVIDRAVSHAEK
jgi:hypothetical protein